MALLPRGSAGGGAVCSRGPASPSHLPSWQRSGGQEGRAEAHSVPRVPGTEQGAQCRPRGPPPEGGPGWSLRRFSPGRGCPRGQQWTPPGIKGGGLADCGNLNLCGLSSLRRSWPRAGPPRLGSGLEPLLLSFFCFFCLFGFFLSLQKKLPAHLNPWTRRTGRNGRICLHESGSGFQTLQPGLVDRPSRRMTCVCPRPRRPPNPVFEAPWGFTGASRKRVSSGNGGGGTRPV